MEYDIFHCASCGSTWNSAAWAVSPQGIGTWFGASAVGAVGALGIGAVGGTAELTTLGLEAPAAATPGYVYGADGARVSTGTIATWGSCDPVANGYVATKDSIPGPSGGQLTETGVDANGNVVWAHTNVWAGGTLLATYDPNGLHFYLNDWNGSRRVQTDYEGVVEQTCTNLPYGNGEICSPTPSEFLYGSLERDSESGLDHAMFRQYSSTFGILGGEVVGNPAFRVGSGFGGRDFLPSDGTAALAARATLRRK